ncbi:MAG: type IV pilus biogenesis protein PilM, partial [Leptospirales bacterium]
RGSRTETFMWILVMPIIALLASGIVFDAAHLSVPELSNSNIVPLAAERQAHLFEIYREAVNAYVAGNPGFSGAVPVDSLILPAGMVVPPDFSNTAFGGTAYAWAIPATSFVSPKEILGSLTQVSVGSMLVGMNQGGVLVSPVLGSTGISLPSVVPNGSVVSVEETVGPFQSFGGTPPWPQEQSSSSSSSSYDGETQRVCTQSERRCGYFCSGSFRRRRCSTRCYTTCTNWSTQYQWASYSCTNYDWIFQPGGSPSDSTSSCTQTSTWWENSP